MKPQRHIEFPPFRLDLVNEVLWRGERKIPLRPKTFAVFSYLLEHAGQLVTKDDLLRAVWPGIRVSPVVPMVCIRELREALHDTPKAPRFIETVHRRGYRFIAPITASVHNPALQGPGLPSAPTPDTPHPTPSLVGREAELAHLQHWLEKARAGARQVVFVTGEAGIGKTTLVEAFLTQVTAQQAVWVARGQCLEQYGAGEAYLPVLDALNRLCREPDRDYIIESLSQNAPTWLLQMPWLVAPAHVGTLRAKAFGATTKRMLREFAAFVERLTLQNPLILWLEDVHWSDYSTLDLITFLAQHHAPARLLLICTYRAEVVLAKDHPLKAIQRELQIHQQCAELALQYLTEPATSAYLEARFAGSRVVTELAPLIHRRTDGNPLFLVNIVDHLLAQGVIVQVNGQWERRDDVASVDIGVPENLRQMIEKHIDGLGKQEQRLLETASVAGVTFSAAAVAAERESADIEEQCELLARHGQFLQARGTEEWPDGTVATRYSFIHTLYQNVLYDRVTAGRRARLHRKIGERIEKAYGRRASERAAELALHCERGREYQRAVQYLQRAAETALARSAYREAIAYLTKGLVLLKTLPDTPERTQQELMLQLSLGGPLMATQGYAAPPVQHTYTRLRELSQRVGGTAWQPLVVAGLWGFSLVRGELQAASDLAEQRVQLAESKQDPALLLLAHTAQGVTNFYRGDLLSARSHFEQGLSLYDPQQRHTYAPLYDVDPGVASLSYAAWVLWLLGYPDQALARNRAALALAQRSHHPHNIAFALSFSAWFSQLRRERQATQEEAEAATALSLEHGFMQWLALGTIVQGWVLAQQKQESGLVQLQQSIAAYRATGAELSLTYSLALLTDAQVQFGQAERGCATLAEALRVVRKNRERYYEAELYRLAGELLLRIGEAETSKEESEKRGRGESETLRTSRRSGGGENPREDFSSPDSPFPRFPVSSSEIRRFYVSSPERCFQKAIEIAQWQQAKSLELRAVMSLARLWWQQGKKAAARQMLAEIYGWFTEGFDTADLQEAKALLTQLTD